MYFLFVILNAPVVMITSRKLTNNPDITSVSVFYSSYECVPSTPNTQPTPFLQQLVFFVCSFYPNMDSFPPHTSLSFNYSQDS